MIIGLGHSGLTMDKKIAEQVEEIDIIVGGHSHSLLYAPTGTCLLEKYFSTNRITISV